MHGCPLGTVLAGLICRRRRGSDAAETSGSEGALVVRPI